MNEDEDEDRDQDRRAERLTLERSLGLEAEEARMESNLGLKLKGLRGFVKKSDGEAEESVKDALCIFEAQS